MTLPAGLLELLPPGCRLHVDAPVAAGFLWQQPFGVVGGEIWCQIAAVTTATTYSVARVPLSSLGVPQP